MDKVSYSFYLGVCLKITWFREIKIRKITAFICQALGNSGQEATGEDTAPWRGAGRVVFSFRLQG